jgi:hypothetical protein
MKCRIVKLTKDNRTPLEYFYTSNCPNGIIVGILEIIKTKTPNLEPGRILAKLEEVLTILSYVFEVCDCPKIENIEL